MGDDDVQVSTTSAKGAIAGYGGSKLVAEKLVEIAGSRGLETAILRLAMVGPDRSTGSANTVDWVIRYVVGCLQLGVYCIQGGEELVLNPVDDSAAVIAEAVTGPVEAVHDLSYVRVPAAGLMAAVSASVVHERRMHGVSHAVWQVCTPVPCGIRNLSLRLAPVQELLHGLADSNPIKPLRHQYLKGLPHMAAEWDSLPLGYPQATVDRVLAFLTSEGLIPSPDALERTHSSDSAAT